MADRIKMAKYYHDYQTAQIKSGRARSDLIKAQKAVEADPGPDAMERLDRAREAKEAADKELEEAYYLAMTGKTKAEATAPTRFVSPIGFQGF